MCKFICRICGCGFIDGADKTWDPEFVSQLQRTGRAEITDQTYVHYECLQANNYDQESPEKCPTCGGSGSIRYGNGYVRSRICFYC